MHGFSPVNAWLLITCDTAVYAIISNDSISTKIFDEQDDFDFDVVNFPFSGRRRPTCYILWCMIVSLEHLVK